MRADVLILLKELNFKFSGRDVKFERQNRSLEDVKFKRANQINFKRDFLTVKFDNVNSTPQTANFMSLKARKS